ncbi:MAG: pilus assembly protein [Phyllobacteriaceae bacterium]|nr:pilus assembly protein [Phyllobacteriaceae bacterium]
MLKSFRKDTSGNYALATALVVVPLLGGVGMAVDYSTLIREKSEVQNALDSACVATGRRVIDGATDDQLKAYAKDFFESNLRTVDKEDATLIVTLPNSDSGGGILTLAATFNYKPQIMPVFNEMMNNVGVATNFDLPIDCDLRLKNTSEIALVLDNSGSMNNTGGGSSKKRITLLKDAAKYLVAELARQSAKIKQVDKPVQFSVVPFSASVNIGPNNASKDWMDGFGKSPVHHENFDWSKMTSANAAANGNRWVEKVDGVWYKRGEGWGETEDQPATRFSLYADMQYYTSREFVETGQEYICTRYRSNGTCRSGYWQDTGYYVQSNPASFATWQGCVEERPYPYNVNDAAPSDGNPATLYVPMFAPDEPGNLWTDADGDGDNDLDSGDWGYDNSWWADYKSGNSGENTGLKRQQDMQKYFKIKPYGSNNPSSGDGPNFACTTPPITPLTDVTTTAGMNTIVAAIDAMAPTSMTNVPDGMAWGWRTVSSGEPFTEGRVETEKGNDKVLIVLTDGLNTYTDLDGTDAAGNKSAYASYGYTGVDYYGTSDPRLYLGTDSNVSKTTFSASNYTKAMNQHMDTLCINAKAAGIKVFTVGLDLNAYSDAAAITSLKACASESKFRKNADGSYKKLFWNTTGSDLLDVFKTIADELSNLRIVG